MQKSIINIFIMEDSLMKKTKIICTMGPNTNDRELIKQLALAGMDIARFNFSHGNQEEQGGRLKLVDSVRSELNIPIATLLDTKGPEKLLFLNMWKQKLKMAKKLH